MKIACYFDDNQRKIGFVAPEQDANQPQKVALQTEGGEQPVLVNSGRVYQLRNDAEDLQLSELISLNQELSATGEDEVPIKEIWDHFKTREMVVASDIIKFLKLDGTLATRLKIYHAILNEGTHFKLKNQKFLLRSEQEIGERLRFKAVQSDTLAIVAALKEKQPLAEVRESAGFAQFVRNLKLIAAGNKTITSDQQKITTKALNDLRKFYDFENAGSNEKNAHQILARLELIDAQDPLIYEKYGLETGEFKHSGSQQVAAKFASNIESYKKRKDFCDLQTYTIDDSSTFDMDDALSVERTAESSYRFYIHISDVATLIPKDSALDSVARNRATSIYTTEQNFNMLPDEVAEGLASLMPQEMRPAVTLILDANQEFVITGSKIVLSKIKVDQKLSYQQATQMLDDGVEDLNLFYQLASKHQLERELNGAKSYLHRQLEVVRSEEEGNLENLTLKDVSQSDFARSTIGEMMVIANKYFAEYAVKNFLPAFFRCQDASVGAKGELKLSPTYDYYVGKPHASMALAAYLQASSPIRRYRDLINQRQIIEHLKTNQTLYDRKALQKISQLTADSLNNAAMISRDAKRYWLLRYLEQEGKDVLHATVVKNDPKKKGLIELMECGLKTLVVLPRTASVREIVKVRILSLKPEFSELKLELVS